MREKIIKITKTVLMVVIVALGTYFAFYEPYPDPVVYVCDGPHSEVYHKKESCRGLHRCSGQVIETYKKDASENLRECEICYRH